MDMLAIIGAIVAFSAIVLGNAMEGGQLSALMDGPALVIVLGGHAWSGIAADTCKTSR